jgi:predicted TIM-barrel fold metal-dependent hydrolase
VSLSRSLRAVQARHLMKSDSNFPVDDFSGLSIPTMYRLFAEMVASTDGFDSKLLFAETAARVYRLAPDAS